MRVYAISNAEINSLWGRFLQRPHKRSFDPPLEMLEIGIVLFLQQIFFHRKSRFYPQNNG